MTGGFNTRLFSLRKLLCLHAMKETKVSIIIAFYKNTKALALIVKALATQTYHPFEVIIAEDDNNSTTKLFIEELIHQFKLDITHVYQAEDAGFRKNKILNQAIIASNGEYLIFIDGDCIPHKDFIKRYVQASEPKTALFGRRVMLSESLTQKLYQSKNLSLLAYWHLLTKNAKGLKYSFSLPVIKQKRDIGIYGCNWGLYKNEIVAINGFDEDYVTAGVGEDSDIEWRLKKNGIQLISIRFSATEYHLHHPLNYSDTDVKIGLKQMEVKKIAGELRCKNGLDKLS